MKTTIAACLTLLALSLASTALIGNAYADTAAAAPVPSGTTPSNPAPLLAAPKAAPATLPALSLPDLEGKMHDSKEWKGKVVLVDFWATWCTGCRETIPVLTRLNEKFAGQGLAVAGISIDKGPKEKIAKFSRKLKMTYPILWDGDDAMSKVFGFEGLPSVYVFGRDGQLLKALPAYTAAQEKDLETLVEAEFPAQPEK